jgi:hypothetical protein
MDVSCFKSKPFYLKVGKVPVPILCEAKWIREPVCGMEKRTISFTCARSIGAVQSEPPGLWKQKGTWILPCSPLPTQCALCCNGVTWNILQLQERHLSLLVLFPHVNNMYIALCTQSPVEWTVLKNVWFCSAPVGNQSFVNYDGLRVGR